MPRRNGSSACGPTTPRPVPPGPRQCVRRDDLVISVGSGCRTGRPGGSATGGRGPQRDRAGAGLRVAAAAPAPAGSRPGGAGRRRAGRCRSADAARPAGTGRRRCGGGRPVGAAGGAGRACAAGVLVLEVGKAPGPASGAAARDQPAAGRARAGRSPGGAAQGRRPVRAGPRRRGGRRLPGGRRAGRGGPRVSPARSRYPPPPVSRSPTAVLSRQVTVLSGHDALDGRRPARTWPRWLPAAERWSF